MGLSLFILLAIISLMFMVGVNASEPADTALSEREVAIPADISRLVKQLKTSSTHKKTAQPGSMYAI